jgi:DNA polymerase-3 subunit beta
MTATDLDVSLIIEQEVDILRSGSICLSGRKLGLIAGTLPNEPVHLKLDDKGEKVEFRAGRFKSKLSGTGSEQFPEVARVKGESVKLPAGFFYEGLKRTLFAVTDDAKRFTISGILLLIEDAGIKMVSTDGHRLCYFRITTTAGSGQNLRCVIPIKAARELKSLLADEIRVNNKAEIRVKKGSQLEFEIGNKTMTAREISGDFPNWEMVIPKEFESFAEINAKGFAEALNRVGVMADDAHRRIELNFYPDKVLLRTESPETGSSVEEVECVFQKLKPLEKQLIGASGENLKIAFNAKYLTDFFVLSSARRENQRIIWKFVGGQAQAEMTFEGEEHFFSYVLVPLKT